MKLLVKNDDGTDIEITGRTAEIRDEYAKRELKAITDTVNIDKQKIYTPEEIAVLVPASMMNNGVKKLTPNKPISGQELLDYMVWLQMVFYDSCHKNLDGGVYTDD